MGVAECEGVYVGEVEWIEFEEPAHCCFDGVAAAVVFDGIFGSGFALE